MALRTPRGRGAPLNVPVLPRAVRTSCRGNRPTACEPRSLPVSILAPSSGR